jgi:peroxiredoxin family protein
MPDKAPPDKLSIVVFSGDYAKVHYALAMASGAAAINRAVTLFFTMDALRALDAGGLANVPGAELDATYAERGVAGFGELLEACVSFGVKFMVCEMGLRAIGMESAELRTDVPYEAGGIVTFLNDASADGAMLFI